MFKVLHEIDRPIYNTVTESRHLESISSLISRSTNRSNFSTLASGEAAVIKSLKRSLDKNCFVEAYKKMETLFTFSNFRENIPLVHSHILYTKDFEFIFSYEAYSKNLYKQNMASTILNMIFSFDNLIDPHYYAFYKETGFSDRNFNLFFVSCLRGHNDETRFNYDKNYDVLRYFLSDRLSEEYENFSFYSNFDNLSFSGLIKFCINYNLISELQVILNFYSQPVVLASNHIQRFDRFIHYLFHLCDCTENTRLGLLVRLFEARGKNYYSNKETLR